MWHLFFARSLFKINNLLMLMNSIINHQLRKTSFQTRRPPRDLLFRSSRRYCRLNSTQAFVSFSLPEVALKRWKASGKEKEERIEIGAITTLNDSRCVCPISLSFVLLVRLVAPSFGREKENARKASFSIRWSYRGLLRVTALNFYPIWIPLSRAIHKLWVAYIRLARI